MFQVNIFFSLPLQPSESYGLLFHEVFVITYNDSSQSVGLVWTSDQLVAEISTWQHNKHKTEKHPWPRWDSISHSQ
jgi:hypothetical protein